MTLLITLAEGKKAWSSQAPTSSAFSSSDVLFSQRPSCFLLILYSLSGLSSAMWTVNMAHCSTANSVAEGQKENCPLHLRGIWKTDPEQKGSFLVILEYPWCHSCTSVIFSPTEISSQWIFSVENYFCVLIAFKTSVVMFEKSCPFIYLL